MEENNTGFSEFAEAFGVSGDNQTTTDTEAADTVDTTTEETTYEEPQEATETAEAADGEDSGEAQESGAEANAEPEKPITEQTFAIKVDKETKQVGIEELKELAQKGGAFDRVKGQLTEARQTVQTLQAELESSKQISDMVKRIAQEIKSTPEELLKRVHINWRMSKGESEKEAIANIEAADYRRRLEEVQAKQQPKQETAQERAKREVAEFREKYPDVEITAELVEKLSADVQNGTSFTDAYRKVQEAKAAEEVQALKDQIAELQKQMAAEKQNKRNRESTPGSQRDSGGQRNKSEFDDFLNAFSK